MTSPATTGASPRTRRHSPLRALIWKEWRQQRWVFILLLIWAYSLAVAGLFGEGEIRSLAPRVLAGLVGVTAVLILSANAFAGERDENTERFLEMIPLSRNRIFWVKLGVVVALVALGLTPVGVWAFMPSSGLARMSPKIIAEAVLIIPAGLLILAIVPALIASCGGSVITVVLVSIPVAAGCLAGMIYTYRTLQWFVHIDETSFLLLISALVVVTLSLAAHRLWSKTERTRRSKAATLTVTAGLLIAYAVVPMAVAYFYVTCFAPVSFFLGHAPTARGWISGTSPTGEYVVANTLCRGWGEYGYRAALVNVETGRAQWFSRFHSSFFWTDPRLWSPSGGSFVLDESNARLWPLEWRTSFKHTYYKVDARSGRKESFDDLCPGLPETTSASYIPLVGWYDEDVFAFQDGRDIFFADTKQHTLQRCRMPAAFPAPRTRSPFQLPITRRGIFAAVGDEQSQAAPHPVQESADRVILPETKLRILRFAPELAESEVLQVTLPPLSSSEPGVLRMPGTLHQIYADQDGERLLMRFYSGRNTCYRYYITDARDGAEATFLASVSSDEQGLPSSTWQVTGFLPDSHQVLLRGEKQLALLDADSRELRRILVPEGIQQIDSVELSPKGGFALVRLGGPAVNSPGDYWNRMPYMVADLSLGTSSYLPSTTDAAQHIRWLGEDHLLIKDHEKTYVAERDGITGKRPLLP